MEALIYTFFLVSTLGQFFSLSFFKKNHGIHFRVLVKPLSMYRGDHKHSSTEVGKLEGEREITLGFVDLLRDDYVEKDRSRNNYFTQDWVSLPGVLSVALGGIHVWHMPALTEIFGDDYVLQFSAWDTIPFAQVIRGSVLITQSILRKHIILPSSIIIKNIDCMLLLQFPEWSKDLNEWNKEIHVKCTYNGVQLSKTEFLKNWLDHQESIGS